MKKIIVMAALSIMSASLSAQEADESTPTDKYSVSTNSFASNWFVTLQGSWSNFMDGGAGDALLANPMWGGSIALGKWFTPGLGLRAKMNGWTMKNSSFATDNRHNSYWILTGEAMFNLTNMLKGYSDTRVWNLIPYVSAGAGRNCTRSHYVPVFGAGVISTWKVAEKLNVNIECSYKALSNDFAGNFVAGSSPSSADRMFAVEAGITYRLGSNSWKRVPDVSTIHSMTQMEIDALNAQIADLEAENERLRNQNGAGAQPGSEDSQSGNEDSQPGNEDSQPGAAGT